MHKITRHIYLIPIFLNGLMFIGCTENSKQVLPCLYVNVDPVKLELIHNDQNIKVPADAIFVCGEDTLYDGEIKIKTRGNFSFYYDKRKPYSISFTMRHHFFDLYNKKSYAFLTNLFINERHLSNAVAYDLARAIQLPSPKYAFVYLQVNDNDRNLYMMANKPKHCVDAEYVLDQTWATTQYQKDPSRFTSNMGRMMRIKEPKHATDEELSYISNLYNEMESAVCSDDGYNPLTGKYYAEYIDINSFARYYIIQELFQHEDALVNSFFMYKKADDSLFFAGPIWDFDLFVPYVNQTHQVYSAARINNNDGGFMYHLYQHKDFREKTASVYVNDVYPVINAMLESNYFDSLQHLLSAKTDMVEYLRKRNEFFYWLYTADSADIVCLQVQNCTKYNRAISIYGSKTDGVRLPEYPILSNNYPTLLWYLPKDSMYIPSDTIFYTNQELEMHWLQPSWTTIQKRRIKKKLKKILS